MLKMLASVTLLGLVMMAPSTAFAHMDDDRTDNDVAPEIADVFSAMHGDLLRCLHGSKGNAYNTVEAFVRNDGTVSAVKTTGGALAGTAAMKCVERRVAKATFPRLRGAGPSKVTASFTLDG
jgi:hypothetical protein